MDENKLPGWILYGIPLVLTSLVVLLCLIRPETFWDRFVWKYYWAPIVADAGGDAGGARSDYNWVDTITYGVVLAYAAFMINRSFNARKLRVGLPFFIAMSPVILIGASARVLEDMELFNEPIQYLFISPIIYIMLGLTTLATILIAERMERKWRSSGKDQRAAAALFSLLPALVISLVLAAGSPWFNQRVPIWPVLLIGALAALSIYKARGQVRWERTVLTVWLSVLGMVVYLYVLWVLKGEWYYHYLEMNRGLAPDMQLGAGAVIVIVMLIATFFMGGIMFLAFKRSKRYGGILSGVNAFILGGHMLDASATFVGIDHFHYSEKHVLPSFLIDLTGTALVMFPLKLLFLVPAFIILDLELEKETREKPHLMALVKLTMLVLGAAPGTRDLIRLALGV